MNKNLLNTETAKELREKCRNNVFLSKTLKTWHELSMPTLKEMCCYYKPSDNEDALQWLIWATNYPLWQYALRCSIKEPVSSIYEWVIAILDYEESEQ